MSLWIDGAIVDFGHTICAQEQRQALVPTLTEASRAAPATPPFHSFSMRPCGWARYSR